MPLYHVFGKTTVYVGTEVWARNKDEALEMAQNDLVSLSGYVGNGGTDKLIGVDGSNEWVDGDFEIEWEEVEEQSNVD